MNGRTSWKSRISLRLDKRREVHKKKAAGCSNKQTIGYTRAWQLRRTADPFINHLFSDIYEFAGQTRTVNFAKGNLRFVPAMYLDAALESIEKMPQSTFDEIVEKYVEMNIAPSFSERKWTKHSYLAGSNIKKELGKVIDWSLVDKEEYLTAMKVSPIKDVEIKMLLKAALTDRLITKKYL